MKIIAATGHRPETLPISGRQVDDLRRRIMKAVEDLGPAHWITGGQRGTDIWVACAALFLGMTYDVYLPFPKMVFTQKWVGPGDRRVLEALLAGSKANLINREDYDISAYAARDRDMVDNADEVFAVWDGRRKGGTALTVNYARKRGRKITILDPTTLEVRIDGVKS